MYIMCYSGNITISKTIRNDDCDIVVDWGALVFFVS